MKSIKKVYFLFIISITIPFITKAQSSPKEDSLKTYRNKLLALPVTFYTPETKFGYGLLGVYLFKAGGDLKIRTSNFDFAFVHTSNNQTILTPTFSIYTKNEKYFIRGNWVYGLHANEKWFPKGNRNSINEALITTFNNTKISTKVLRRVLPYFYVGLQQQLNSILDIKFDSLALPETKSKYSFIENINFLKQHKTSSGVGFEALYDSRDNILNTFKGSYFNFVLTHFNPIFGSNFQFSNLLLDFRKYKNFHIRYTSKKGFQYSTIAAIFLANFNASKKIIGVNEQFRRPPINQLASLGGNLALRGFYRGRFKDLDALILQTEYRQHIFGIFGMTAFLGAGEVASEIKNFKFNSINYAFGLGARFMIKKDERLNIRLDFGFGNKDSTGLYFGLSEAF